MIVSRSETIVSDPKSIVSLDPDPDMPKFLFEDLSGAGWRLLMEPDRSF